MNQPELLITHVAAIGPSLLALAFADGNTVKVNLADVIAKHPTLARLADPDVFALVGLDEWQRGVVFDGNDELSLASDNLRALGMEQQSREKSEEAGGPHPEKRST